MYPKLLANKNSEIHYLLTGQGKLMRTLRGYKRQIDEYDIADQDRKYAKKKENAISAENFLLNLVKKKMNVKQREKKDRKVRKIIEEIYKIDFGKLDIDFEQIGSCVNGYSLYNSDYDFSIITSEPVDERVLLTFFSGKANSVLNDIIGEGKFSIETKTQVNIRIPLVDIDIPRFDLNLSFSVNNKLGIYNSKLLKTYAKFDDRCRSLNILVKIWAKTHKIFSAKQGFLSSYAYHLMVINFLQTMDNPVLPSLQAISNQETSILICRKVNNQKTEKFTTRVDFESESKVLDKMKSEDFTNDLPVVELLEKFFKFCSQPIKLSRSKLSVKKGRRISRSIDSEEMSYLVSIEDPFDLMHNPGRYLKANTAEAERFLNVAKKSYMLLRENRYQEVFLPFI